VRGLLYFTPSVKDQAEAIWRMICQARHEFPRLTCRTYIHVGGIVPLDLRIRRILLPVENHISNHLTNEAKQRSSEGIIHTSNHLDLGNSVRISEDDTDLRWSSPLLRKFADLVNNLLGGGLEPRRRGSGVWDGRG